MFRVVLVGAGDRGMIYARQSLAPQSQFQISGVVEPNALRRKKAQELFRLPDHRLYESVESLVRDEKIADAAFNCTMDALHTVTSLPLMEKGYHILLEKPIAVTRQDAMRIIDCARRERRIVMVCHVLRYSPFYTAIRRIVRDGEIGRIISIQMAEDVSYFHESVSYVRGFYADPAVCGSGMLLSKCSHDLDLMAWLMDQDLPTRVFSAGSVFQFRPENAPEGAGTRCLVDCKCEQKCIYSARRLYVDHPQRWANRVWNDCALSEGSDAEKLESLKSENNPYGRCVYKTDLKIVDHQSLLVNFRSGATGTFTMTGGASAPGRSLHIIGTRGEIQGTFEDHAFTVSLIHPDIPGGCLKRQVSVSAGSRPGDAHGGGDENILQDFFALLDHREPSICCTSLEASVIGHNIVYGAEESRLTGLPVPLDVPGNR